MEDVKASPTLIHSKLHRPVLVENYLDRPHLIANLDQHLQRPLTLVSAPAGYGKSMLAAAWLEASSRPSAWVSLDKSDNDLRLFLSYFLTAIQSCTGTQFSNAARETQAMVNALRLPPMSILAGTLINEIGMIETPFTLALDDFHLIKDESVIELIGQLLHHPPKPMHLVLISRRDPPLQISSLRAKNLMHEIRIRDLRFNNVETAAFLTQVLGAQVDPSTAAALKEKTEGWVTGLYLAALFMRHRGNLDPRLIEPQVDAVEYVMEYLFSEVFAKQPPEISQYLLASAVLDRFCGPICEALRLPSSAKHNNDISGWDFIAWLKKENMFLVPLDAENRWFRFHHLFQSLLLYQLKRHLGPEDINVLHTQASAWFAENGLIEEALKHTLTAGNAKSAAGLVARHGFALVSEERWPTLERWLKMLPGVAVYQDLELLVLLAWTHMVFSRHAELMTCLDRAEAQFHDQPHPPAAGRHLLGNLEAMRAFQYFFSAEGDRAVIQAQRAIENIPPKHRWPRIFVYAIWVVACQMIGDSEKAQSIIEEMTGDDSLRGGTSEVFLLTTPCFFYWVEADLAAMLRITARVQKISADLQNPWTLGHVLHFSGIANYHLNNLDTAEEKLLPLVKSPYLHHTWNFAHSAFALALIYCAWGRAAAANEIAESVISFALDTNNTATLKIARAFRAELALRQGRLAEASRWAKQFAAHPFQAMYRFYVPQLTLAKVLLAQDTTDSRKQAGDLLRQLYDFVVSTHNIRFQIDVLALLAVLHNSQHNEPAALMALSEALVLAEPGGFIRPFVDLGSQIANLLKQLQKQNVTVDYIKRILAAFRDDQSPDHTISKSSGPPFSDSPQHPLSQPVRRSLQREKGPPRPGISQPLVEALTNRELDVLELLAQRLSNNEIAEKLFVSVETVKSHLKNTYQKLNVRKRRQAIEKAKKIGII